MTMLVVNSKTDSLGNKIIMVHDSTTGNLYEVEYLSTLGASIKLIRASENGVVTKRAVDLSDKDAKRLFSAIKGTPVTKDVLKEHLIVYSLMESKPRHSLGGVLP